MDLTDTITPRSDQMNAEDLLTGPRTFTVERVSKGNGEQPVDIHLVEFPGRPFRPSKTVRRILVNAWGPDASAYAGRRMTLYRDPSVKFGGMDVGGIRVSHLSHIDKPLSVALTVSRGKRQPYTVQPLPTETPGAGVPEGKQDPAPGHDLFGEMQGRLKERFGSSRAAALEWIGWQLGHDVTATKDMAPDEVALVVAVLAGNAVEVTGP